jgi:hypothetical protein
MSNNTTNDQKWKGGWRSNSAVQCLHSMHEILGLIPSTKKDRKNIYIYIYHKQPSPEITIYVIVTLHKTYIKVAKEKNKTKQKAA